MNPGPLMLGQGSVRSWTMNEALGVVLCYLGVHFPQGLDLVRGYCVGMCIVCFNGRSIAGFLV